MSSERPVLQLVGGGQEISSDPKSNGNDVQESQHRSQEEGIPMSRTDRWSIIGTIIGSTVTLLTVIAIIASGFITQAATDRSSMQSTMDSFRAEAADDRRAAQVQLDAFRANADADRGAFRQEMAATRKDARALAERQSRIEGMLYQFVKSGGEAKR